MPSTGASLVVLFSRPIPTLSGIYTVPGRRDCDIAVLWIGLGGEKRV